MLAFNSGPLLHYGDLPTGVVKRVGVEQPMVRAMAAGVAIGGYGGNSFDISASSVPGGLRTISSTATQGGVLRLQEVERRAIEQALPLYPRDRTTATQLPRALAAPPCTAS